MFKSIRNLFRFRPKKFLGVDIGTSAVRVVELGKEKQNYKLENYGEIKSSSIRKRPFRVFEKNTISLSNQQVAKAIQAICREAGIETREVNFSIPDFCSFFTSFELPIMAKDEIPQAVQYEVRPYVPLPLEEVILDWTIIKGEPSKTPLKILVAAIPRDAVSQYQEISQLAGLELKALESEVFALARTLGRDKSQENKIAGLIDIGARSTTCSILEQGVLKTSYSFNIAGNELTEVIANSLNIDYNKAEEMKKEYGLITEEGRRDVRKILIPLVDSILEEIKKAFRSFYLDEGKEVQEVILAGGQVLTPGLKEYFSTLLKKPVVIADPFLNINCPAVLADILKEMGPYYAIAVGLAMKGLE